MLTGGLGFVTLYEITEHITHLRDKKPHHFSLQSKMVLWGSLIGIIIATVLIFILERNHSLQSFSFLGKIVTSIFQAVSFRSTGLLTVPICRTSAGHPLFDNAYQFCRIMHPDQPEVVFVLPRYASILELLERLWKVMAVLLLRTGALQKIK